MHTLHDYVRWIADSMNVDLNNDNVDNITHKLATSEKYKEMLRELEDMIQEENKVR